MANTTDEFQTIEKGENAPLEGTPNFDEFNRARMMDEDMRHRTTGFGQTANFGMQRPARETDVRSKIASADGFEVDVSEPVMQVGAPRYEAFTQRIHPTDNGGTMNRAQQLLGQDMRRSRVLVSNTHGLNAVLIGPRAEVENGAGFSLAALNTVELRVSDGLYAAIPIGGSEVIELGVWAEYA